MSTHVANATISRAAAGPISTGFTLIELLVTVALLAVLMMIAAPSFITYQRNSELTATANSFLASLASARAEAMKRQLRAFVIPTSGNDWKNGWVVFVDANSNATATDVSLDSGDIKLAEVDALPSSLSIATTATSPGFVQGGLKYAMYNGSGFLTLIGGNFPTGGADSIDFNNSADTGTANTRRVIASVAGRMRVCKPAVDPGCSVGAGF